MILGATCTRGCRFCDVDSGKPLSPDPQEPQELALAVEEMGLRYVVITSVDRDDLPDFGAAHFVAVVAALAKGPSNTTVELLTPDFCGDRAAIEAVASCGAEILGHNLETTRALSPSVRDKRCDYDLSLRVLSDYRRLRPKLIIKMAILPLRVLTTISKEYHNDI